MFREVARVGDIRPGGMKAYEVNGKQIVLCNDGGKIYAFDRKCGHMSAPLDMGTANGYIVTCPLHSVQFDASTGEALSEPLLGFFDVPPPPKTRDNLNNWLEALFKQVRTDNIKTYAVRVEGDTISVDL